MVTPETSVRRTGEQPQPRAHWPGAARGPTRKAAPALQGVTAGAKAVPCGPFIFAFRDHTSNGPTTAVGSTDDKAHTRVVPTASATAMTSIILLGSLEVWVFRSDQDVGGDLSPGPGFTAQPACGFFKRRTSKAAVDLLVRWSRLW